MPLYDYMIAKEMYMRAKLGSENFDKELEMAKSSKEIMNNLWCGVENIELENTYLFFLTKSFTNEDEYIVTGTTYFGQFTYDKENQQIYRAPKEGDLNINTRVTKKELIINFDNLNEKIKNSDDKSEILREEFIENIQQEDTLKAKSIPIIEEKDPQFDKYKTDFIEAK